MTDFVMIYHGGGMPETPEEQERVMGEWTAWFESLGSAIKDPGNPLLPTAKQIGADGSVSDIMSEETGYTVISANSIDEALGLAKGCPLAGSATMTIHEAVDMT